MPSYTSVSKPITNYEGTPLWSAAYFPWLSISYPWIKLATSKPTTSYDSIAKPSTSYTNIAKPA